MSKHQSDLPAALTGLLVGAVAVLILVIGMVKWTNSTHAAKPEAGHTTTPH